MEHTSRRRQVEIFNFSFLDILACVIGLLIFILTVVVISGGINTAARKTQSGSAMGDLETKVRDARRYADAAATRRREAEQRLNLVAGDIGGSPGPMNAAARVNSLNGEAHQLQKMLANYQQEKDQLDTQSTDIDSALSAQSKLDTLRQETARLEKATADIQNRTKELAAAPAKGREISYYVPRLRSTDKMQSWLDVSSGKVWRLDSDDYVRTRSGLELSYVRSSLASGTTVDSIVKTGAIPMQSGRETLAADKVVITCIVRPDAYDDFRRIRDIAWSKGYAVHWIPLDQNEEIVLTIGGGMEQ